ncbi:N-acetylmuramoyl-L-alanine amidase [Flavobacterium sp. CHNK8]|uniref:N-acetylmuramoyl-L-alanine amidase family protein n=1 Tax=Flavobacterium sp. CHNK8 TaxID=2871165 RepID=UPI001C8E18E3|nr:N-acetylmuramoyl-L-alanine amidase [Flavobacterium sp. CHNK8]QZK90927.1 N-acetylmuramoyl-L-alanine amidase [Flavobacterium sp. CHNK8]
MKKAIPFFLACATMVSLAFVKPSVVNNKQIHVVIDAGHGGIDFGATSITSTEKQIVEQISKKIKFLNKNENVTIHFTRNDDQFVSLTDRADFINKIKPNLVLSLHVNQSRNEVKSGMEFYVANESLVNDQSIEIANELRTKFLQRNAVAPYEIKKAPFLILKKSVSPAVLIELGYLSNSSDRAYLTDDKKQDQIATTILSFVADLK